MKHCIQIICIVSILTGGLYLAGAPSPVKNAVSHNADGWQFLKRGDSYRAIFSFKNALKKNPRYREALMGLGRAYYEVEAYNRALELFRDALKMKPRDADALLWTGLVHADMGDFPGALKYIKMARQISGENLDAKYAQARLYYKMGRLLWARRGADSVLRQNPFHLKALLLMADIKSGEKRLLEARKYAEKAMAGHSESPAPHWKYGEILLKEYLLREDDSLLTEGEESLKRALSIQPDYYHASRLLGIMEFIKAAGAPEGQRSGHYRAAIEYFKKAMGGSEGNSLFYNMAVAADNSGLRDEALKYFAAALREHPVDSVLKGRFENFLVVNEIKIGHPSRVLFMENHLEDAKQSMKANLPDRVILSLRLSLLMNPMNREGREYLMEYHRARGLYRLYLNEMKALNKINPEKYRDRLTVAVVKRREKMYHREGFSGDMPPRDIPSLLVLNFHANRSIPDHIDGGTVIASRLSFVLGQFGRQRPFGFRSRKGTAAYLRTEDEHIEESLEKIGGMVRNGVIGSVDYVVYGNFRESGSRLSVECSLLDFHRGIVIADFSVSESGKDALNNLALRLARRIYGAVPFSGRVLKKNEEDIVVNLGLIDGVKPGSMIVVGKGGRGSPGTGRPAVFTIKEADTYVSKAVPKKKGLLKHVDSRDTVLPLTRRRATRIE